jgi:hypothetical protein
MRIEDDRIPADVAHGMECEAWREAKAHLLIGFVLGVGLTLCVLRALGG